MVPWVRVDQYMPGRRDQRGTDELRQGTGDAAVKQFQHGYVPLLDQIPGEGQRR